MEQQQIKLVIIQDVEFERFDKSTPQGMEQANQRAGEILTLNGIDIKKPFIVAKGINSPVHVYIQHPSMRATPISQLPVQPKPAIDVVT